MIAIKNLIEKFKITFGLQNTQQLLESGDETLPYDSLSPVDNVDLKNDYGKALDWALHNRKTKEIRNIAITGPYGSGKSSILKTYIKQKEYNKNSGLRFLSISLATFKEDIENQAQNEKTDNKITEDSLLRLIEISILQQIFYHEKDSKIPDSRFRKIKNFSKDKLWKTTIILLVVAIAFTNLYLPKFIPELLKLDLIEVLKLPFHYISILICLAFLIYLITKSVRLFSSITISKINFQNTEIGIGQDVNKSVMNHHLDEILYFFEATDYNVVIIEDLDRFKRTEIFTKLREINLLINNSKKIEQEVVFIYAIRDDIFIDETERAKFFDFIIPVIPIVNSSNSGQMLLNKIKANKLQISESLIESISLFIDDMRLLHNISNEYYLYQAKLSKKLNQDKLLAIVVYKNLYPTDFFNLSNYKGELYKVLNHKKVYIKQVIDEINEEIQTLKTQIEELEEVKIKDIEELRKLYIFEYIASTNNNNPFIRFINGNNEIQTSQMVKDDNFELLISNNIYYKYNQNYGYTTTFSLKFKEIEEKVDKNYSYDEREKLITNWNNQKGENYKRKIQDLERQKTNLRGIRLKELLSQNKFDIPISDLKQKNFVSILLRNGYIEEDYLDYVSIFYEGSITRTDNEFLINVNSQINSDFDLKLNKIENLIKKIDESEYSQPYILNFSLLDYALKNNIQKISNGIISQLSNETEYSIKFIDNYISQTEVIAPFVKKIVSQWPRIWQYIEEKSNFTIEQKDNYFSLIIEYSDLNDIVKLSKYTPFLNYIIQKESFLSIIPNIERLKDLIKAINIKFKKIDFQISPIELIDFIYKGNYYELNIEMVSSILKWKEDFNQIDFDTKNYSIIQNSSCVELIKYIGGNLPTYLENIYLELQNYQEEEEKHFINLLNNKNLAIENKLTIIQTVQTKISDILLIEEFDVQELLFENDKVAASWNNIFKHYEAFEPDEEDENISDATLKYLNNIANMRELSQQKIKVDKSGETQYSDFINVLLSCDSIEDENYDLMLKSISIYWESLDFTYLSTQKLLSLINSKILELSVECFNELKKLNKNIHISYLEVNKDEFIKQIEEFEIDKDDVYNILYSNKFTEDDKATIVENIDAGLIISKPQSIKKIGELILYIPTIEIDKELIKATLNQSSISDRLRIKIFIHKSSILQFEEFDEFFNSLDFPYEDICILGKRPLLENTETNYQLAEVLHKRGYISNFGTDNKGIRINTFKKR